LFYFNINININKLEIKINYIINIVAIGITTGNDDPKRENRFSKQRSRHHDFYGKQKKMKIRLVCENGSRFGSWLRV